MAKPRISIISAISQNRAIGKKNKLLWHIGEDLRRFKALTEGHPVVMGRKTFESLGKALPNRTNIVVTRDKMFEIPGVVIARSLEEAIEVAKKENPPAGGEIFIIGGGQIYEQAIKLADKLYLTIVEGEYEADTFFPDYSDFKKVIFEEKRESEGYKYEFLELER
jgi:dihydrofolate reductase